MTYAYTTPTHRRLVLGPPEARHRLCLPIAEGVYTALLALSPGEQTDVAETLTEALWFALRAWQALRENAALSAVPAEPTQTADAWTAGVGAGAETEEEEEEP